MRRTPARLKPLKPFFEGFFEDFSELARSYILEITPFFWVSNKNMEIDASIPGFKIQSVINFPTNSFKPVSSDRRTYL